MTKSNLDLARECGATLPISVDLVIFTPAQLDAFAERIRANANRLTALLANWDARALCALPADAMIVNKMARELREALAQHSPAAVERKPFIPAQRERLYRNADASIGKSMTLAAFHRVTCYVEEAHGIGITAQQGEPS